MKKTLFILGLCLSFAFLNAQDLKPATQMLSVDAQVNQNWTPPTIVKSGEIKMLWDNTEGMEDRGYHSCRWTGNTNQRIVMGDDFIIPEGETWIITEVYAYGFIGAGSTWPENAGVAIYKDNGEDRPTKTPIYENAQLMPNEGMGEGEMTIELPEPFEITEPGKYWISIYGSYATAFAGTKQFYVATSAVPKEAAMCRWDPSGKYTDSPHREWSPDTYGVPTMAFYIKGERILSINENVNTTFSIAPNPATNNIRISAGSNFHTVEVVSFLGQTILSQSNNGSTASLDVSNLSNGVYFIRTISEKGTSVKKFVKQ